MFCLIVKGGTSTSYQHIFQRIYSHDSQYRQYIYIYMFGFIFNFYSRHGYIPHVYKHYSIRRVITHYQYISDFVFKDNKMNCKKLFDAYFRHYNSMNVCLHIQDEELVLETLDKYTVALGTGCVCAWMNLLRYFKFHNKFHVSILNI